MLKFRRIIDNHGIITKNYQKLALLPSNMFYFGDVEMILVIC